MDNRYLFRGQVLDSTQWVRGGYVYDKEHDRHLIFVDLLTYFEVDPPTLGMSINLYDSNKDLIFEGDIVDMVIHEYAGNEISIHGVVKLDYMGFVVDDLCERKVSLGIFDPDEDEITIVG